MRNKGPLYLITISKPKGPVWFSRQRMGEHKIGEIMKSMAKKSGLSASTGKKFTNHSSRKTCVQKLKSAGVPRDQIIDVTGHRSVTSLSSYEGDDENQCRQLSFIISGNNPKNDESKSNPSPLQPHNNSVVNNTFTGTVNFYGGFGPPGMPGPSTLSPQMSPNSRKPWKRLKVLSDSDED